MNKDEQTKLIHLYTPQQIIDLGYKYEDDRKSCRITKARIHIDCNYFTDGKFNKPPLEEFTNEQRVYISERLKDCYPAGYIVSLNCAFIHRLDETRIISNGSGVMCRWLFLIGRFNGDISHE
jgi:hypothetical protein